jgi:hypothetical protein
MSAESGPKPILSTQDSLLKIGFRRITAIQESNLRV